MRSVSLFTSCLTWLNSRTEKPLSLELPPMMETPYFHAEGPDVHDRLAQEIANGAYLTDESGKPRALSPELFAKDTGPLSPDSLQALIATGRTTKLLSKAERQNAAEQAVERIKGLAATLHPEDKPIFFKQMGRMIGYMSASSYVSHDGKPVDRFCQPLLDFFAAKYPEQVPALLYLIRDLETTCTRLHLRDSTWSRSLWLGDAMKVALNLGDVLSGPLKYTVLPGLEGVASQGGEEGAFLSEVLQASIAEIHQDPDLVDLLKKAKVAQYGPAGYLLTCLPVEEERLKKWLQLGVELNRPVCVKNEADEFRLASLLELAAEAGAPFLHLYLASKPKFGPRTTEKRLQPLPKGLISGDPSCRGPKGPYRSRYAPGCLKVFKSARARSP